MHEGDDSSGAGSVSSCQAVHQHWLSQEDLRTGSIIITIMILSQQRNCDCDHIHKQPEQTLPS